MKRRRSQLLLRGGEAISRSIPRVLGTGVDSHLSAAQEQVEEGVKNLRIASSALCLD